LLGHLADADAFAAANIHGKAVELVGFRGQQVRAGDVLDE
jgi:hypothetical protein